MTNHRSPSVDRPPGGGKADRRLGLPVWLFLAALAMLVVVLAVAAGTASPDAAAVQNVAETLNAPQEDGQMIRSISLGVFFVVLIVAPLGVWIWLHNSLVSKEETVFESWAQTESNLQRRADLVPALVQTVSRYLGHEGDTLIAVTEQRSGAATSLIEAVDALVASQEETAEMLRDGGRKLVEDEAALAAFTRAQSAVERNIMTLLAVAEDYPELRSSDHFLALQAQLEGTENRINVARMRFNDSVRQYNAAIRKAPGNLIANLGGFARKAYFQIDDDAHNAPALQFD